VMAQAEATKPRGDAEATNVNDCREINKGSNVAAALFSRAAAILTGITKKMS
jgi:hypothetical protein